jgi:hypothetical protein
LPLFVPTASNPNGNEVDIDVEDGCVDVRNVDGLFGDWHQINEQICGASATRSKKANFAGSLNYLINLNVFKIPKLL